MGIEGDKCMIEAIQGEFGIWFEFTVYKADRSVHTLVGDEIVSMRVQLRGETAFDIGAGSVYNATEGIIRIFITESDSALLKQGVYTAQISLLRAGQRLRTEPFDLQITAAI